MNTVDPKPVPKVLYLGSTESWCTSGHRLQTMVKLGWHVEAVNTSLANESRLQRQIARICYHAGWSFLSRAARRKLQACLEKQAFDVVWVDSVQSIGAALLKRIHQRQSQAKLVAFIMDDPFAKGRGSAWRPFLKAVPEYDICWVPRDANIQELHEVGARDVRRYHKGYTPEIHRPLSMAKDIDVFFAGHCEPKRAADIAVLLGSGIRVVLAGSHEWATLAKTEGLETEVLPRLCNEDYAAAICRSKICLCFYSQWNRDTDNSRMYEIPACGVFMLAERNDENVRVFAEGVEADFFSTPEELVAKVRHYLVHDAEREAIAARGLKRCRSSGYSYAQRLATMMQQISAEPLHCSGEG